MNKEAEIQKIITPYLPQDKLLGVLDEIMNIVYTTYVYTLDDLDVSTLQKFWKQVVDCNFYKIDVRQIPFLSQAERLRMTQLRFFGLIAKVRDEKKKQIPNMWLLTTRGAGFLDNKPIPNKIYARNNMVKPHPEAKMVSIKDFKNLQDFGPHYEIQKHEDIIRQLSLNI